MSAPETNGLVWTPAFAGVTIEHIRMTTRLYFHPACLDHDPGPRPGLAPARLHAVIEALRQPGFEALEWREASRIGHACLELVHTPEYVDAVLAPIPAGEQRAFDFETFATSGTAEAALYSAGGVLDAVTAVAAGQARNALCLASPGGHHAEAETAQGFCFFNHVAMGAVAALKMPGIARVAVLDFDAHHGNGTQSLFWSRESCCLVSLHEDLGLTGFRYERGAHDNILNLPLPPKSGSAVFRDAVDTGALPKIAALQPDLLLVSAGFDMHRDDPLADLCLEVEDYAWLGARLARFAGGLCHGRLVAVLEGGYNVDVLGYCAAAFVGGLIAPNACES